MKKPTVYALENSVRIDDGKLPDWLKANATLYFLLYYRDNLDDEELWYLC